MRTDSSCGCAVEGSVADDNVTLTCAWPEAESSREEAPTTAVAMAFRPHVDTRVRRRFAKKFAMSFTPEIDLSSPHVQRRRCAVRPSPDELTSCRRSEDGLAQQKREEEICLCPDFSTNDPYRRSRPRGGDPRNKFWSR